jgi:hypothetical protein
MDEVGIYDRLDLEINWVVMNCIYQFPNPGYFLEYGMPYLEQSTLMDGYIQQNSRTTQHTND